MTTSPRTHLIRSLEGYRALAILSVLFFHVNFSLFKGGFIGVDFFFVISGFIITKNIVKQVENGTFTLGRFYFKRFRRLFPALLITVLLTLIAGYFILSPSDYESLGKSSIYSVFSLANINFWMEAGYFDTDSHLKPLLHMWSLSVEEQFYLFWPLAIVLSYKFFKKHLTAFVLACLVISLVGTVYFSIQNSSVAFFWFPFRVFQFMAGALIGISAFRLKNSFVNVVAFIIFALAVCLIDNETNIALTGTVAAVSAGLFLLSMESKFAERAFGNSIMVFFGQHSYSIYLVHWPLIVFYKYLFDVDLNIVEQVALLAISVLGGYLLRLAVEQPLRVVSGRDFKYGTVITTSIVMFTIFLASNVWGNQGYQNRFNEEIAELLRVDATAQEKMRRGSCFLSSRENTIDDLKPSCYTPAQNGKGSFLIIGSSLAADLYHGFNENFPNKNIHQVTATSCQPLMYESEDKLCSDIRSLIFEDILKNHEFELVILGGIGANVSKVQMEKLKTYFSENGIEFVIIGPRPIFKDSPDKLISQHGTMIDIDEFMNKNILRLNEETFTYFEDPNYFSLVQHLCPTNGSCEWRDGGTNFYRDKAHFSPDGSVAAIGKFKIWLRSRRKA